MKNKNMLGAAVIALTMGMSGTAHAFNVNTGFGNIGNVAGFDWTPNSALAVDSLNLSTDINNPTAFTIYSQGSLGTFTDNTASAISADFGLNSAYEITFESGFGELGVQNGLTALFGLDPNASVNFFNMYYDTDTNTFANPLAGTGYADGDLILSGVIIDGFGTFSQNPFAASPEDLDQFGGDDWAGTQSVVGVGSNGVDIDVLTQNDGFNFFLDNVTSSFLDINFSSNATSPFELVDPSRLVAGQTANFGADGINGTCGANERCDFLFQTDAASGLRAEIPEPGMIAIMGFGLLGMAATARRRRG